MDGFYKILNHLQENPEGKSIQQIASHLGLSYDYVSDILNTLKTQNRVRFEWVLTKRNKKKVTFKVWKFYR
jgi:DNA-binding IclR family transcriptional regulator